MMDEDKTFRRSIGLWSAVAIVIGSIIGSGIFIRPADIAAQLGSPSLIFLVWVVAGGFTFFNALIQAEVGAMLPETGGQYAFMRTMYGNFWAYLYGWAQFAVVNTAGTAAICFIGAQYTEYFISLPHFSAATEQSFVIHLPAIGNIFPLQNFGVKCLTIFYLTVLTIINYRSTSFGSGVQRFLTFIKILSIAFIVFGFFISGKGSFENLSQESSVIHHSGLTLISAFIAAVTGALYSYDGWGNVIFVVGEMKSPRKNLPLSLIAGIAICILCYITITAAYLYILPVDLAAHSSLVASDAAQKAFGSVGGGIIAGFIIISVLGCVNANILTPPRLTFAMSHHKEFFHFAGKIHPRFHTPANALWLHLGWMIFTVLIGSFYMLADMFIFVTWCLNLMMIYGLFILRKKYPEAERPFKVWGYPVLPFTILILTLSYLVLTLYSDITSYLEGTVPIINSVFGIAFTLAGVPLFLFFRKKLLTRNKE